MRIGLFSLLLKEQVYLKRNSSNSSRVTSSLKKQSNLIVLNLSLQESCGDYQFHLKTDPQVSAQK